jgi:hypothetical protein
MQNIILPTPNEETKFFWEGCKRHKLLFQRCFTCGLVRWPVNIICPECLSREYNIVESKGRGVIFTYVIYHYAYHEAFKEKIPYNVAIIKLKEGPMILSNIIDCNNDALACELPVEVVFEDINGDVSLPKFKIIEKV